MLAAAAASQIAATARPAYMNLGRDEAHPAGRSIGR
jgi:hypothetical protein